MYYKEKIINGVLCCQHHPNGEWFELSKIELTERIKELKDALRHTENAYEITRDKLEKLKQ